MTFLMVCVLGIASCNDPPGQRTNVRDHLAAQRNGAEPGTTVNGDISLNRTANDDGAIVSGTDATAGASDAARAVAFVNGAPISRQALMDLLLDTRALNLLQQLMLSEAVRQEAERAGIRLSQKLIDDEYDLTIEAARFNGNDPTGLTPARRETLIDEYIQKRGLSRQGLDLAIRRQAYLRRLAERDVTISDDQLVEEFKREYGDKVEIRHLQLASLRDWERVKLKMDNGVSFEKLIKDYSINRITRDGEGLMTFSQRDEVIPRELRDVAFALDPGQVSNVLEIKDGYHVIKLERRIPADEVEFERVKDRVRENYHQRLVNERMEGIGRDLILKARLWIKDPALRDQYVRLRDEGRIVGPVLSSP